MNGAHLRTADQPIELEVQFNHQKPDKFQKLSGA